MRSIWSVLVFVGCHPGSVVGPDAPDEAGDGTQPSSGLFIAWRATPALPGPLSSELTVSDATFQLDHFQVTSDAGSSETTRSRYLLAWSSAGGPMREEFPDAPVGVYSKVSLALIGGGFGDYAYQIRGTWKDSDDNIIAYEIRDRAPLYVGFDCDTTLSAEGSVLLTIKLDLKDAIERIDFNVLQDDDEDVIEVKGGELMGFRDRLKRAFKVDDVDEDE